MVASLSRVGVLASVAAVVLVAACASQDALRNTPKHHDADLLDLASLGGSLLSRDTSTTFFIIDPNESATYSIAGGHRLFVRAAGVCDLASPYGIGTWDDDCISNALPVLVTAKSWLDDEQHPHIEFSPALRFAPAKGDDTAVLFLRDKSASSDDGASILYCADGACVNEGAKDTSLCTQHDRAKGFIYRRIKHFSGYQVSTGRDGESPDSTSVIP